jgi:hypothetical protein
VGVYPLPMVPIGGSPCFLGFNVQSESSPTTREVENNAMASFPTKSPQLSVHGSREAGGGGGGWYQGGIR